MVATGGVVFSPLHIVQSQDVRLSVTPVTDDAFEHIDDVVGRYLTRRVQLGEVLRADDLGAQSAWTS